MKREFGDISRWLLRCLIACHAEAGPRPALIR
jgi:hypothetical protein